MSSLDAGGGLSQNGLASKALSAGAKVTLETLLLHSNNSLCLNGLKPFSKRNIVFRRDAS